MRIVLRIILFVFSALVALSTGLILIFANINGHLKLYIFIVLIISVLLLILSSYDTKVSVPAQYNLVKTFPEDDFSELNDKELEYRLSRCDSEQDLVSCIYSFQLEKDFRNSDVCSRGCIDTSNYSKILSRKRKNLDKHTIIKIAYGLDLTLDETKKLLTRAGYCFSESEKFDTIIQYCLEKNYDAITTDCILCEHDLPSLFVPEHKEESTTQL